ALLARKRFQVIEQPSRRNWAKYSLKRSWSSGVHKTGGSERGSRSAQAWRRSRSVLIMPAATTTRATRVRRQADRLLPPAVPSNPGKRCVVGQRVHRVDQRRAGPAELRRPLSAASAGGARLL